jgi:ring-1,2-phenylacetyl-CoA epoxidase subunit PaaE
MSREPQQSELLNGRIDGDKVRSLARHIVSIGSADEYLICGPGAMVDEVRGALARLNGAAPVRFERFTSGGNPVPEPPPPPPPAAAVAADDQWLATITVTMDGRCRSFPMFAADASVLAAAERAGLNLPFSCRSGICATCRARITQGTAVMAHNIALESWETGAGFVLCCQARPTSALLDLTYDEK